MEKKKGKLGKKIAALMAILTIGSCCFLGTTFAKYTSSTSGTASTQVALWQIDGITDKTASDKFTLTVDKISPKMDNTDNVIQAGTYTIANKSEVDANVTVTVGAIKYYLDAEGTQEATADALGLTGDDATNWTNTIKIEITNDGNALATPTKLAAQTGSMTLNVKVTWDTQNDVIDTAIGMKVKKVAVDITVVAEQASEITA